MPAILTCTIGWPKFGNIDIPLYLLSAQYLNTKSIMNGVCVINVCKHLVRFFEKHAQNLNTPQDNSARWDIQMGFNSACKGAKTQRLIQGLKWLHCHQNSGVWTYISVVSLKLWMSTERGMNTPQRCAVKHGEDSNWFSRWSLFSTKE